MSENKSGAGKRGGRRSTSFRPGQSGNPGGRPKALREVQECARQHTAMAIAKLAEIAEHGKSESAQIAAANALLDRAWGKPLQSLHATSQMEEHDFTEMTDAELAGIIRKYGGILDGGDCVPGS